MSTTTRLCRCGEPGAYKTSVRRPILKADGTYSKRWRSEPRLVCRDHYLESMFGLWPYRCAKACEKARAAASDMANPSRHDFLLWIPLDMMVSTRDKKMHPKCPWCSRKLRPYPPPRREKA